MENGATGRNRRFTDAELRDEMQAGETPASIAAKFGVSKAAVYARIKQIQLTTTSAAVAPVESKRFVNSQINLIEELSRALGRVNLLFDAVDAYLRDSENPEIYDFGPRSTDLVLTYFDAATERNQKATLQNLLDRVEKRFPVESIASKLGDPRTLLLSTSAEVRQISGSMLEIARLLADIEAMQKLQQAVMLALAEASPEVAQNVAEKLRSTLVLRGLVGEPADVFAGGASGGA